MQLSVLGEYRAIYNNRLASFHEAQIKLNRKIWLEEIVEEKDGVKVYAIHDKRIKVIIDTIVKVSRVNYVQIRHHWRMVRRKKKLKVLLNNEKLKWKSNIVS